MSTTLEDLKIKENKTTCQWGKCRNERSDGCSKKGSKRDDCAIILCDFHYEIYKACRHTFVTTGEDKQLLISSPWQSFVNFARMHDGDIDWNAMETNWLDHLVDLFPTISIFNMDKKTFNQKVLVMDVLTNILKYSTPTNPTIDLKYLSSIWNGEEKAPDKWWEICKQTKRLFSNEFEGDIVGFNDSVNTVTTPSLTDDTTKLQSMCNFAFNQEYGTIVDLDKVVINNNDNRRIISTKCLITIEPSYLINLIFSAINNMNKITNELSKELIFKDNDITISECNEMLSRLLSPDLLSLYMSNMGETKQIKKCILSDDYENIFNTRQYNLEELGSLSHDNVKSAILRVGYPLFIAHWILTSLYISIGYRLSQGIPVKRTSTIQQVMLDTIYWQSLADKNQKQIDETDIKRANKWFYK